MFPDSKRYGIEFKSLHHSFKENKQTNLNFEDISLPKSLDLAKDNCPHSLAWLYDQLYLLTKVNSNPDWIQQQWISLWNNNFTVFSRIICNSDWNNCRCSFHRYKKWLKFPDNSLLISNQELIFWQNEEFAWTSLFPYQLDKKSFLDHYYSQNSKSLQRLDKLDKSYLNRRLTNLVQQVNNSNIQNNLLNFSTLTFAEEFLLPKVYKIVRDYLKSYSQTFFIFPERHKQSKKWHLHLIHSHNLNLTQLWTHGQEIHSRIVTDLNSDLAYVTKDWVSYMFLPLQRWGLKRSAKFYLKLENNKQISRESYLKEYIACNYARKLLINQKSKLLKKINSFPVSNKLALWKSKLLEVNSLLHPNSSTVASKINIQSILENSSSKNLFFFLFLSLFRKLDQRKIKNKRKVKYPLIISHHSPPFLDSS